jgi:hypothetical protein
LDIQIAVRNEDYGITASRPAFEVETGAYVKIPVCLSQPILTGIEIGAIVAGVGLTLGGMYLKQQPAELVGEILIGAAAFTAIYRLSCL